MSLLASPPSLPRTMTIQPLLDWGSAAQSCKNFYFNWNGDDKILDRNMVRDDDTDGDINTATKNDSDDSE